SHPPARRRAASTRPPPSSSATPTTTRRPALDDRRVRSINRRIGAEIRTTASRLGRTLHKSAFASSTPQMILKQAQASTFATLAARTNLPRARALAAARAHRWFSPWLRRSPLDRRNPGDVAEARDRSGVYPIEGTGGSDDVKRLGDDGVHVATRVGLRGRPPGRW